MNERILLRPFGACDHAVIAALYDAARPLGLAAPDRDNNAACRLVAESETGQVVGYGAASGGATSNLVRVTHPDRQGQGIDRRLWEGLVSDLTAGGTGSVEAWVRHENAAGFEWLQKQGFVQINLDGPIQFLLAGAKLETLDAALSAVAAQGITVTTLAEEKARDPECLVKLHDLYTSVEADVSGNDPTARRPLEEFIREWDQPQKLLFLAKEGERYIGLSTADPRDADPYFEEKDDIFQQHLTGVRREYRQRGIATALKGRIIAYARQEGYRTLWTNSDNPAMRALNWKLGFRTGPWLAYRKTLSQETAHA